MDNAIEESDTLAQDGDTISPPIESPNDSFNASKENTRISSSHNSTPLTPELISKSVSLISRTGDGLSYAYSRLDIHNTGVTSLDTLETYPHLRYIDCSDNQLVDISTLAKLEFLLSVNVSNNKLRNIPEVLDKKRYLQHVNLSKNHLQEFCITSWPIASWINLNGAESLDNSLIELTLQSFPELVHLEVRGNKLSTMLTCNTPKLQRLYLAANGISALNALEGKPCLQLLHLRGNSIQSLEWINGVSLPSLTYLNLRANKISTFDQIDPLKDLTALRILVLAENPIDQNETYRLEIISRLPKLDKLDKKLITIEEREEAATILVETSMKD
ncbi:hypothetical protein BSLG_004829 [Batrachochytrium salamandrivorans]|nr:hypothetical protein BSLG_004945 [Batrachochytrium salamandrivorans]KAJ1340735.1 hypothetical protein BSLG_004829 [Batrachochytrium salamandrivorans]